MVLSLKNVLNDRRRKLRLTLTSKLYKIIECTEQVRKIILRQSKYSNNILGKIDILLFLSFYDFRFR